MQYALLSIFPLGIFPYEALTSLQALKDMKQVPHIDDFYSSLTGETITQLEHDHAVNVFKTFKMNASILIIK
jgi:hypothetical protein